MSAVHMTTLPTPITDVYRASIAHTSPNDYLHRLAQLERDCMTMALRLYGEDPDTFSPETRECMERWAPRVEALLGEVEA